MTTGYAGILSWAAKSKAWDAVTSSASKTAWEKEINRASRRAVGTRHGGPAARICNGAVGAHTCGSARRGRRRFQRSPIRLMQLHWLLLPPHPDVQALDPDGESHREIDIAFWDFLVKALG